MVRGSHTEIVKPQDKRSDAYEYVRDRINEAYRRQGLVSEPVPSQGRTKTAIIAPASAPSFPSLTSAGEAPPIAVKPEETERVFVPPELTPKRLRSFYRENTSIQAAELTKNYIGQWMKVTGCLGEVIGNEFRSQVTFQHNYISLEYFVIFMYFREPHIDRLKILRRGDKLTVIGQIQRVESIELHLDNCELVDSE
jgi:hypothetical protein